MTATNPPFPQKMRIYKSEHPLGKAIVDCAKTRNVSVLESDVFKMTTGRGIYAEIEGKKLFCGNEAYLDENGAVLSEYG